MEFKSKGGYYVRVIKGSPKGLKEIKEYYKFRLGRYYIQFKDLLIYYGTPEEGGNKNNFCSFILKLYRVGHETEGELSTKFIKFIPVSWELFGGVDFYL